MNNQTELIGNVRLHFLICRRSLIRMQFFYNFQNIRKIVFHKYLFVVGIQTECLRTCTQFYHISFCSILVIAPFPLRFHFNLIHTSHRHIVCIDAVALYRKVIITTCATKVSHVDNVFHIAVTQQLPGVVFFRTNSAYNYIRTVIGSIRPILLITFSRKAFTVIIASSSILFGILYVFRDKHRKFSYIVTTRPTDVDRIGIIHLRSQYGFVLTAQNIGLRSNIVEGIVAWFESNRLIVRFIKCRNLKFDLGNQTFQFNYSTYRTISDCNFT